jgi:hypothetical protein
MNNFGRSWYFSVLDVHSSVDVLCPSRTLGQKWNASLSWALKWHWTVLGKLADYKADEYLADTRKLWLSVDYLY